MTLDPADPFSPLGLHIHHLSDSPPICQMTLLIP